MGVITLASAAAFICTPVAAWDGDGPIWCKEGPKIRISGIAAREMDGSCSPGHPYPSSFSGGGQGCLGSFARWTGRVSATLVKSSYGRQRCNVRQMGRATAVSLQVAGFQMVETSLKRCSQQRRFFLGDDLGKTGRMVRRLKRIRNLFIPANRRSRIKPG